MLILTAPAPGDKPQNFKSIKHDHSAVLLETNNKIPAGAGRADNPAIVPV